MQYRFCFRLCLVLSVLTSMALIGALADAQTLTWGVNGAGGGGNWDATTANWFNGATNVAWPSGASAVFGGASGGTVSSYFSGPVVSSMTFNTAGYTVQNGDIQSSSSGLTVTTNVDATISSSLDNSTTAGNFLVKNGSATLSLGGEFFLDSVQVNQGQLQLTGSADLVSASVVLANAPGVAVTFGQTSSFPDISSLSGGGTSGGAVQPNNQARTVMLTVLQPGSFAGALQNNGSGILAMDFETNQTLTSANTYSGATTVIGTLTLSGNGSVLNSAITVESGTLSLDNSGVIVANRISSSLPVASEGSTIKFIGNSTTPAAEALGVLSLTSASTVTVTQPGSAAAQLTFAGVQRNGQATLNVSGPNVEIMGLSNGSTGILPPYFREGNNWAIVGSNGSIAAFSAYATNINSGSTSDHVQLTASGTTTLNAPTTRASLNLQNANANVGQVLDLAGSSLALTSGGILSSGAGSTVIQNGSISTPAQEIVVTANNNLTIASTIADGGSQTTLTKTGPGILTLTGTNTYSGPTAVVQGTLIVSSDANLGSGSAIDLSGGTLQAAGSFSSAKGITMISPAIATVNTAGFNLTFTGATNGSVFKNGQGTLTLTNTTATNFVEAGTLALPNGESGDVEILGGNLQVAGTLPSLDVELFSTSTSILDIGGPAAARLTTNSFGLSGGSLLIDFGIGSTSSDFWTISGNSFLPFNTGAFQFEFQNLGGVATGINYPLMSFSTFGAPSTSIFAFAPDMAAAGWSGTFTTTTTGVSVRFTSVPVTVPEPFAWVLALQGLFIAVIARWRLARSRGR